MWYRGLQSRRHELAAAKSASGSGENERVEHFLYSVGVRTREEFGDVFGGERFLGGGEVLADGLDLVGE